MSDITGDPTWDGGWEDATERGDSLEQWMLKQDSPSDDQGMVGKGYSTSPKIADLAYPDRNHPSDPQDVAPEQRRDEL